MAQPRHFSIDIPAALYTEMVTTAKLANLSLHRFVLAALAEKIARQEPDQKESPPRPPPSV